VGGYRVIVAIIFIGGLLLYLNSPQYLVLIVLGGMVASTLLFFITMRPVPEPDRAVVYRLAKFSHLDGPGYVFLIPTFDKIEGTLDMATREPLPIEVPQIRTADNEQVRTNLEITWRIHPDVQGHVSGKVKNMILMSEESRKALILEIVINMARQVVSMYTAKQLNSAAAREAAGATMMDGANEILEGHGMLIERVFWRGSPANAKVLEAKVESMVAAEHADSLIKTVEAIRTHLPDMQPEEFLALQAWLDMFRRGNGGTPPGR
jgi:regulator of protease activity HflC (stomatin/prohibitin superfamily)